MELPPSHHAVAAAREEIAMAITRSVADHHLTYGQLFRILAEELGQWAKYLDRDEQEQQAKETAATVRPADDFKGGDLPPER